MGLALESVRRYSTGNGTNIAFDDNPNTVSRRAILLVVLQLTCHISSKAHVSMTKSGDSSVLATSTDLCVVENSELRPPSVDTMTSHISVTMLRRRWR